MKKYKKPLSLSLLTSLIFLLVGCQGPTQQKWATFCQNDEWASHGYFDATEGFPFKLAAGYRERCGPDFSEDDMSRYQFGYLKGLKEFCTWDKGFELAKQDKANPDICPPEMQREFIAGYKEGRAEYAATQTIILRKMLDKEQWDQRNRPPSMSEERAAGG